MSMYNLMFGKNPTSDMLLAVIGFKQYEIPRFRDVNFQILENDVYSIVVFTRMGGGNKDCWEQGKKENCDCPACKLEKIENAHELFIKSEEYEFDRTYSTLYFKCPEEFVEDIIVFPNIFEHGLRKEFANHIGKTIMRSNEEDIKHMNYKNKMRTIESLNGKLLNGHTFVPFCMSAMESCLKLAEENDGDLPGYGLFPAKLDITTDKNKTYGARFYIQMLWEADKDFWKECKEKYISKYPKAIEVIETRYKEYFI